ncbi:nuclear transport factor 2 family protein [Erythrobacter crassostreae]|uniref:Nuclear transport factor 2 family protein n=1 Tax=Erythrobacter crassostreae TaxID=2828328 RepID=A0A9X1F2B9_9SPHN|nr:nuclear transport factor 2 family protein [Erythrobacter crassostrea]MBV7258319.1 nuclear transport factor 2 family protein [Erythrobacter crassostrea]
MSNTILARQLFDAFQAGDADAARAVCSSDMTGCQNGGPKMPLETILHFAVAVKEAAPDFRYENIVCAETASGFVEEHRVRASFGKHGDLDLLICIVADVSGGKITALREYFDTAAAAALGKALGRG